MKYKWKAKRKGSGLYRKPQPCYPKTMYLKMDAFRPLVCFAMILSKDICTIQSASIKLHERYMLLNFSPPQPISSLCYSIIVVQLLTKCNWFHPPPKKSGKSKQNRHKAFPFFMHILQSVAGAQTSKNPRTKLMRGFSSLFYVSRNFLNWSNQSAERLQLTWDNDLGRLAVGNLLQCF